MIVAVALGLLIGVALGALGGGGSILAVPVLAHLAGQSAAAATATSLVAVGAASAVAALGHARAGRVRWRPAFAFVAVGVPGSWLGATLNDRLNGDLLLLAFSLLVLVAAQRMVTACPSCTRVGEERHRGSNAALTSHRTERGSVATAPAPVAVSADASDTSASKVRVLVAASLVGVLTGLFGVGGGFVIVPALTLALGLSMPTAIGTSLIVIVGNAVVALAFRGVDAVEWDVAVPFASTMLVGSTVGAVISRRLPAERSLGFFAGLLVAVAIGNGLAAGWALLA